MIDTDRSKLLEHPLFETFILLKWLKLWKIYSATFLLLLVHLAILTVYSLSIFTDTFNNPDAEVETANNSQTVNINSETSISNNMVTNVFFYLLLFTNLLMLMLQIAKVISVHHSHRAMHAVSQLSAFAYRRDHFYPILDLITPVLGFFVLFLKTKEVTGLLIIYSSWQFTRYLTVFPRIGKNIFITSQVTRTILEFFLSYLVALLAFTLTFRILLDKSKIFNNLGDSFIKVVMMLLGEFEFEDLNEHNEDINWMTKIVFLLFVILMSIVLINLVIGLSISDVAALR